MKRLSRGARTVTTRIQLRRRSFAMICSAANWIGGSSWRVSE